MPLVVKHKVFSKLLVPRYLMSRSRIDPSALPPTELDLQLDGGERRV